MRRLTAIVLLALLAACSDDDGGDDDAGIVDRSRPVPDDVRAFIDRVADPASIKLSLDYDLLNKNGGSEHSVHVESPPLRVTIDGDEVDLDDEPSLARYGIFSGFLAENPRSQIESTARRSDAGDAVFSERGDLDCIAVPVQGSAASTWCLTAEGVFGYVDTPAVRYSISQAG